MVETEGKGVVLTDAARRDLEQALRESEERFRVLQEASFGGIGVHENGVIVLANSALAEMTGHAVGELIGMNGLLLIEAGWRDYVLERILTGYEQTYEAVGLRRDGSSYPLEIRGKAVPYKGRVLRATEFRDISERKKLQQQFLQAQKMESIGRLAGGVAHDFNNMLTPILGCAELLLLKMPKDEPLREEISQIAYAAERAKEITQRLLSLARKQVVELRILDVGEIIRDFERILRRTVREDIDLVVDCKCEELYIKTDAAQIEQILLNLVVNAQDAMPEGGVIRIQLEEVSYGDDAVPSGVELVPGRYALLEVRDNGAGMSDETVKRVFEPFFTTRSEGTGLGLSTVGGIVEQQRGAIRVNSAEGEGTSFVIWLPTVEYEPTRVVSPALVDAAGGGGETILLVEDEELVRRLAVRILAGQGYSVLEAADGLEALQIVEERAMEIQLLLTDVVMPKMDGRALEARVRAVAPHIGVVFMSGYTDDVIAMRGLLERGVHLIQKPFSVETLLSRVREAIDEKRS